MGSESIDARFARRIRRIGMLTCRVYGCRAMDLIVKAADLEIEGVKEEVVVTGEQTRVDQFCGTSSFDDAMLLLEVTRSV
jgi:hypothetical protein